MLPFRYFDKGSMATIGRAAAVAQFRGRGFSGFIAWLAWLFIHLIYLIGSRIACSFSSSGPTTT